MDSIPVVESDSVSDNASSPSPRGQKRPGDSQDQLGRKRVAVAASQFIFLQQELFGQVIKVALTAANSA